MTRVERIDRLFDYAAEQQKRKQKWTRERAASVLGWAVGHVDEAIQGVRDVLGESNDIALPCEPNGQYEDWLYWLTDDLDEVRWWLMNRLGDGEYVR